MTGLQKLLAIAVMPLILIVVEPVRGQSALDGFDPHPDGLVRVIVIQPDGKILIVGDFTHLSPNGGPPVIRSRIARLNSDGTLDTIFNPNANSEVYSIALQPDGKILVGGWFTDIGGQPRNYIARLDAITGSADSFDPDANSIVNSIAVQADGKIVVSGGFDSIGGQQRSRIARLDATTGLADSFNPNPNDTVFAVAVEADGEILLGGLFTSIGGQSRNHIARLDANTGLADSFDPNATNTVFSIAVQADRKILVGGGFHGIHGQTRNCIARLDATTGLADSFNPNANDVVYAIAAQADGKILAGGQFTSIGGHQRNNIARLDPASGSSDSFDPSASSTVLSIAVQADGKILAGGGFNSIGGQPRNCISRLETDGRLDQTLDVSIAGGIDNVRATALQPDGKILIGGSFTTIWGVTRNNIARLNTDGTLDTAFNPNADGDVQSISIQADGKILVGGHFTNVSGQTRNNIARLDATTGLADSFNPNAVGIVVAVINAIAVQPDGKISVGGTFTSIGGQTRNNIARLDATTGLADSFDPNANSTVSSIAVQVDGKILVTGGFFGANSIGGQTRNRIARLDAATGLADSFDPNADSSVGSIDVLPDGKILVGGAFTTIGGQMRNGIARLDAATGLADSFDPNADGNVLSIAMQADDKILVSGTFTSIGGQQRNRIARLDATTGLADPFDPDANDWVHSISVQADGKILTGGIFVSIGGQPRSRFARLLNDTTALQDLVVMRTAVTWTGGGSSPQFTRVTFEYSTDNLNYTVLGDGTAAGSSWTLTGLNLPTGLNFYIRARGYYRSGVNNASDSIVESVRTAFLAATLGNISTRLQVGTADRVMIAGFIITGTAPKHVIIRAIGPSLSGVPDVLVNPRLELHDGSGANIGMNDNWQTTQLGGIITSDQVQEIQNSGLAPIAPAESAIIGNLTPGVYTAIVEGVDAGTGVGLVEVYDLDTANNTMSRLSNISTRGFVQTGNDVMIGGIILVTQSTQVMVRAIGPSLGQAGVPDPLANPQLELHDVNGTLIAQNNDWQTTQIGGIITMEQVAEIQNSGLAPTDSAESAIIGTLQPGAYTAIVRGVKDTTGNALVEVYGLQ